MQVIVGVIGLAVVVGFVAMLGLTVFDALFRPGLRRLAVRNIARRPGEAVLVVAGSMIGTAIITASFVVGDTFENSIVDEARRTLGPIDVEVRVDGLDQRAALDEVLADLDSALVDGELSMIFSGAAIADVPVDATTDRRAEPFAGVAELDFDSVRAFGPDPSITGFADAGPTPSAGEVVINERLARTLDVEVGEQVEVFAYGTSERLVVRDVLQSTGVAGYRDAFVPLGTIERLTAGDVSGTAPPTYQRLYSAVGGVLDTRAESDALGEIIEVRVAETDGVEVRPIKGDVLEIAETEGESVGQLFSLIGSFSVIAGILLLVNLFVMLSEERKGELGMLRAIGLKRNHLLRAFSLEGAIYSVLAAVSGGFAGIGVGWIIGRVVENILTNDDRDFRIVFAASPASVVQGMVIGLVIALVTAWLTSGRIARMNVIRAIRDLPEPPKDRLSVRTIVQSSGGMLLGIGLFVAGFAGEAEAPLLAGPAITLLASIPLLRRLVGDRWSVVIPASAALLWGQAVFTVFGERMDNVGVEVFLVQGVVLVTSAVLLLSTADVVWHRISDWFVRGGRGLAGRLALAYPLARKVRTGILLSMFALVIFVMTFMSVFTEIFGKQAATFADKDRGGFDVFVDSNFSNPVRAEQLQTVDGVGTVASFVRGFPEFTSPFESDPTQWSTAGFDRGLIDGGPPHVAKRAAGYASDAELFEAVLVSGRDGTMPKAVVPDFFLATGGGPPSARPSVGQIVTMYSPTSDETLDFEVVGVSDSDFVWNGLLTSREVLERFLGTNVYAGRHYVATTPGTDPLDLAIRLDGAFLGNGVDAQTFQSAVEVELAEQQGFFRLMQGYLGLGLLIGVAGLGVVMVRAVRERRRQVGILRAMGFTASTVRRAFLFEAGFIALQGIVVGIGLGLLTAYQVLVSSNTFGEATLPFAVPWIGLAVILGVPLGASLLATVTPAAQAAAIRPAVALRIAD